MAEQIFADSLTEFDQILTRHLVVDAERGPAHRPVRLPLQLAVATSDGNGDSLGRLGIVIRDRAVLRVVRDDRHVKHLPGARTDRQERRIGRGALLPQRRQHDRHHLLEPLEHLEQRRVELAGFVIVGRAYELVFEAELIEERAQPRIVVVPERGILVRERVRHAGQRLVEMRGEHLLVRHVVRHLAQAVHVIGEGDQPRLDPVVGQHAERMPHHGRAGDLAERADVRQAGRTVAGLEQHLVLRLPFQPRDDLLRLLERPGVRLFGKAAQVPRRAQGVGHDFLRMRLL